jgi:hypothetical protein
VDQGRCKGGCLERLDVCAVIITEGVTLVASGRNDFLFLNKDEESEEEIANVRQGCFASGHRLSVAGFVSID